MSRSVRHNLPAPLSSFIGRKKEIAEVIERVAGNRLVTLTGAGGSGKTRLAIEAAKGVVEDFEDGLYWIELAALTDGELVPQTVATALGISEAQHQEVTKRLVGFLEDKEFLLLIDNCEHLIDACAQLAENLLQSCPDLKILTTSREPLGITGESVYVVPPLTLPDPRPWTHPKSAKASLGDYQQSEAVRLFVERAAAASPDFQLTMENGPWVAEICRHLDGMPLAIELAAARVRSLAVRQIAERLDDRFKLLTLGSRTSPARQQTLLATLDWSYGLLSVEEQTVLRRLSVFAGGWTLEAAEAVCSGEEVQSLEVLDFLTSLMDRSFVTTMSSSGENRYVMLETVREYAKQRLAKSGEQSKIHQNHAQTFLQIAQGKVKSGSWLFWPQDVNSVNQLEVEHDNFRAALSWSVNNDPETAVQLAAKLAQFWQQRGYLREGLKWFEEILLSGGELSEAARAESLFNAGYLRLYAGEIEHAETRLQEAEGLYRKLDDQMGIGWQLVWLAWAKVAKGNYVDAITLGQKAAVLLEEQGDTLGVAVALAPIGEAEYLRGDYVEAEKTIEKSLALVQEKGILFTVGRRLSRLSQITRAQGNAARATQLAKEGLTKSVTSGDYSGATMALGAMAAIAEGEGETRRAATLLGSVAGLREIYGAAFWFFDQLEYDHSYEEIRSQMDPVAFKAAMEKGRGFSLDQAVHFALSGEAQPEAQQDIGGLTAREREVAALIAQGKSNREIAEAMTIQEKTVETYVTRILDKLGLDSRVQVALWAVEKGLGPPGSADKT